MAINPGELTRRLHPAQFAGEKKNPIVREELIDRRDG